MSIKTSSNSVKLVVGVGASAGGLSALRKLFSNLEDGSEIAFILVQHLDGASGSLAHNGLTQITKLPLVEIQTGIKLSAGTIFHAPPHSTISLDGGIFNVEPTSGRNQQLSAIDDLFRSLAADQGHRAVGIVLSGEGSDGNLGLKAIGEAGGMTMAQLPDTADFRSMPENAVASGVTDHVLAPDAMPAELAKYAMYIAKLLSDAHESAMHAKICESIIPICEILQAATRHDFKHYKTTTLVRRIQRRMQVLRLTSVDTYVQTLSTDSSEVEALFKELLINVTCFFRDPEAFEYLQSEVLAKALEKRRPDHKFRAWIAGCSTGEEVYSIAILVREILDKLKHPPEVQIIATDIDNKALELARKGSYPLSISQFVSADRLKKFFVKRGGNYHISKEVRELVLFSSHNLINDPPFSQLDLISCRNVMIYLGGHLQQKLIPVFHYALRAGGCLFLGTSESIATHKELFRPISNKHRIAQRKATAIRPPGFQATMAQSFVMHTADVGRSHEADLHMVGQRIVLDEFAPRYAIVNEEAQIISVSAEIHRYLEPSEGSFQNNLMKLVKPSLRVGLRKAFNEAKRHKRKTTHEYSTLKRDSQLQRIGIVVQPMPQLGDESSLFMVVFQDFGTLSRNDSQSQADVASVADVAVLEQLELELRTVRADLDKSVQDLEASNEELKSSNEELLSMNEELQSANEELESSKEEVQAVNDALQLSNNDLENLLRSTDIATLFLDDKLCIQSYTPALEGIYNITRNDIGRPIAHFTHNAIEMKALPDPKVVTVHGPQVENDIELRDGRRLLRRISPYRTTEGNFSGVVITFIDVTFLRQAEDALRVAKLEADNARIAAEAANHSKTLFLANMSHEIRTPLAAILGFTDLLKGRTREGDEEAEHHLDRVSRNADQLGRLIDELLDLSKIEAEHFEMEGTDFDLRAAVEDALSSVMLKATEKGLRFSHNASAAVPTYIHTDETRLRQILINVIGNAIKFTEHGHIEVNFDVIERDSKHFLQICVQDTGIGLTIDQQKRIFEPFVQADSSVTRKYGGTGLGLVLSRRLALIMGGDLVLRESQPGVGSVFEITIEFKPVGAEFQLRKPEPPARNALQGKTFLVVDDSPDNQTIIQLFVATAGGESEIANHGIEAIALLKTRTFAAVLMDIQMPQMDGYQALKAARKMGYAGPILALTAHALKEERDRCLSEGFDGYLSKPIERVTLIRRLIEVCAEFP